jgi:hypothetical protein
MSFFGFRDTYINKIIWSNKNLDEIPAGTYCIDDIRMGGGGFPGARMYWCVEMYDYYDRKKHYFAPVDEEDFDIWEETFRIAR